MAISVKRKKDEAVTTFLYRFNKAVQHSGVLKDAKKNKFHNPKPNKNQRRKSTLYKVKMGAQIRKLKKSGVLKGGEDIKSIKKMLRNPKAVK